MKNKFRGRCKYRFGFAGRVFLTLALALGLMVTALLPSKAAETAPDGNSECTLTVKVPESVKLEEKEKAKIKIDVYKVADVGGTGSADIKLCPPFTGLTIKNNMTAEESHQLAQAAAEIVKKNVVSAVGKVDKIGDTVNSLAPGLYLLIARGEEPADYFDENNNKEIVTKIVSDEYAYTFSPVLVALPGAEGNTKVDVVLKMEREADVDYGSLRIVKTLNGFAMGDNPATFVFQVEAALEGQKVYSNVVTLVFDGEGRKELLVENIPIGSKVTVTEVYSGASYSLTSSQTQTVTIPADQIPAVTFTNRYDERENGGQSITNHFKYDESDGWKLQQRYDESQG